MVWGLKSHTRPLSKHSAWQARKGGGMTELRLSITASKNPGDKYYIFLFYFYFSVCELDLAYRMVNQATHPHI